MRRPQFHPFRKIGRSRSRSNRRPKRPSFRSVRPLPTPDLVSEFVLEPGAEHEVTFLLCWHFAGGEHGRMYGNWFRDASSVATHLQENLERLTQLTRLFRDTYFDSTLPHWLLARLMMPISTLATNTVQWRRNGRFWAWEGVGCCDGTCTHVWNYAQGMARLFPELERSARMMQDLGVGFDPKTGRVGFRGENPTQPYAADGQCGTVLKCYREHLMSKDGKFLEENWPKIKQVMEYELGRDKNDDGVIEDRQWNTYDLDFVGPNTFVGALYLAALLAAAKMADLMGDREFAKRCREIAAAAAVGRSRICGTANTSSSGFRPAIRRSFNTATAAWPINCSGRRGPTRWLWAICIRRIEFTTALKSIYRYNWAPDVAAQSAGPSAAALVRAAGRRRALHLHVAQRRSDGRAGSLSRRSLDGHRVPGRLGPAAPRHDSRGLEHLARRRRSLRRQAAQSLERSRVRRPLRASARLLGLSDRSLGFRLRRAGGTSRLRPALAGRELPGVLHRGRRVGDARASSRGTVARRTASS